MSIGLIMGMRESIWAAIPGPCQGFPMAHIYIFIYIYSYIYILIYRSTAGIPISLCSCSSSTEHHHLTLHTPAPSGMSLGTWIQMPPNPVPCSQAVTLSRERPKSHHLHIPPLQHPELSGFSSARGRRERCQNQASCSCEHRKGSCSLSQNPHLLWHTPGQGMPTPGSAVGIARVSSTAPRPLHPAQPPKQ